MEIGNVAVLPLEKLDESCNAWAVTLGNMTGSASFMMTNVLQPLSSIKCIFHKVLGMVKDLREECK